MEKNFNITSDKFPNVSLRTITWDDLENLRIWKNRNRKSFFYQEAISPTQQVKWFDEYLESLQDYIVMVISEYQGIGCLGFRYIDGHVDIYNVIRGVSNANSKGFMGKALRMMCSYASERYSCVLEAKVLRNNPALDWYQRKAFKIMHIHESYVDIELDLDVFVPCSIKVTELK
jgi:RimJ/RimL family protein N-acetyltransferase